MIRILTDFAKKVRPNVREILDSYNLMAAVDFIRVKRLSWLDSLRVFEPQVAEEPHIDWIRAIHPLLQLSLERKHNNRLNTSLSVDKNEIDKVSNEVDNTQDYDTVLEERTIRVMSFKCCSSRYSTHKDKHLLIISGPNAGGKSVCLKTVGLLQYMLQCGLSIPVGDRSTPGILRIL